VLKVSVTDLTGFDSCRRSWLWGQTYRPAGPAVPLWVGEGTHAGLEGYYRGDRSPDSGRLRFKRWQWIFRRRLHQQNPRGFIRWEDKIEDAITLAEKLLEHYYLFDEAHPLTGTIVSSEKKYRVYFPDLDARLTGKIDVLVERDNGLWVVDHKTLGPRSMEANPEAALEVDEQMTAYCYLVWKVTGRIPRGIILNVLLKSVPEPPYVTRNGLSRSKSQSTTAALYRKAIVERGEDEADYEEILAYLDEQPYTGYFRRFTSRRNVEELMSYERRARAKIQQIRQIVDEPEVFAYPTPTIYNCGYCEFLQACKCKDEDVDYQSILDRTFLKWT
jgi:hypothetical protein